MKNHNLAPGQPGSDESSRIVPYLLPDEIQRLAAGARTKSNGERDYLFILLLYQTGLRISEALSLTPAKIIQFDGKPVLDILGKGGKPRLVSCPEGLARKLNAYARHEKLESQDRFFPFNRIRGWQIVRQATQKAGIAKRVFPHLLRHSDAIERLRQTGNPKALQHHLGHSSISMVMRYLSTLTQEESLRIHQQVEFEEEDEHSPRLAKFDIIQIAPRPNMSPAQMVPINLSFDEKGWRISNKYF